MHVRHYRPALVMFALALLLAPAAVAADFTVVFRSESIPADFVQTLTAAGGTLQSTLPEIGVAYVSGPGSLMNALGRNHGVQAVSPALQLKLPALKTQVLSEPAAIDLAKADLYKAYGWDVKQMTNDGASWSLPNGTGSHGTVVGIIDSGVSTKHSALKANLLGGVNFTPDGPGGTVVASDIEDKNGHGSHVAGSIAGNGRILGVAPDIGFRSYRVFAATGGTPSSRIWRAIQQAVLDGVDVITMSIGGYDAIAPYYWTDPETGITYRGQDVGDFVAYKRIIRWAVKNGVPVIASAGNDAINTANPAAVTQFLNWMYGADGYRFQGASREVAGTLPGVINVSATGPTKQLASYSNYGPGSIDLTAPGGDFQRYPAPGWHLDMCLSTYMGTGYVWMAGTSMSAPKVAAVAALLIDQAKAKGLKLTPAEVTARLQQSAVDIGKNGYDPYYGYGFVNAYSALIGR